jgi:adenylate kinase
VTGPPASGKSFYSQELATYYNIPRVHIKQISDLALEISLLDEEKIGEDEEKMMIKTKCDELRENMAAAIEEARGEPPEDTEWPEIDKTTLPIRVTDEILWKLLSKRITQNDCRNRGYVLDGFPRVYKDAQYIFLKWKQTFDEEGNPEEEPEQDLEEGQAKDFSAYIPDLSIMPSNCIVIHGEDKDLIDRVRNLSEAEIEGTHYNAADMQRRLKSYRLANNSEVAEPSIQDFFKNQGKITLHNVDAFAQTSENALCSMKIYIERVRKIQTLTFSRMRNQSTL